MMLNKVKKLDIPVVFLDLKAVNYMIIYIFIVGAVRLMIASLQQKRN